MNQAIVVDPRRQRALILSVAFASFMVNLDTYIVNISLPAITDYFDATTSEVSWVSLTYNLTVASLLLIFGKLGDRVGMKKLFMYGYAVFTASSLLCGLSTHMSWLLAGRCLQGIGASVLYAMTPAMISKFLPKEIRGVAFGTLATVAALGITVAAPLGGLLTGLLSWHWIFLINIPTGVVAIIVCHWVVPQDSPETGASGCFDIAGAVLSFTAALTLVFTMNQGHETGWASSVIVSSFLLSVLSFVLFLLRERSAATPLLELRLFSNLAFTLGNLASVLAFAFLAGHNFLLPFYLTLVAGMRIEKAGAIYLIYSLVYMAVGPAAGRISKRVPPRTLCTASMILGAFTAFGFAVSLSLPALWPVMTYLVLLGVTFGLFVTSNNTVVMDMAPDGKQGMVSGVYRMFNRLGMTFGVCFFETVFSHLLAVHTMAGKVDYETLPRALLARGFKYSYLAGAAVLFVAMAFSWLARSRPPTGVSRGTASAAVG
ncbi:MAG: MFS transporter [Acidobacteriota bacterium]